MRRGCEYRVIDEGGDEALCGKPAVAHITWPDGLVFYYCAPHYDERMNFIRDLRAGNILPLSGGV